jgi:hypothetical protein
MTDRPGRHADHPRELASRQLDQVTGGTTSRSEILRLMLQATFGKATRMVGRTKFVGDGPYEGTATGAFTAPGHDGPVPFTASVEVPIPGVQRASIDLSPFRSLSFSRDLK